MDASGQPPATRMHSGPVSCSSGDISNPSDGSDKSDFSSPEYDIGPAFRGANIRDGVSSERSKSRQGSRCCCLTSAARTSRKSSSSWEHQGADPSVLPPQQKVDLWRLLRAICSVSSSFFKDPQSRIRAWVMTVLISLIMWGFAAIQLWFLKCFREFQNALHQKDEEHFYHVLKEICMVALIIMPAAGVREALKGCMALEWRRYLTNKLLNMYIGESQAYYRLKLQGCDIDNPDQRIVQDCGTFTDTLLKFLVVVGQAVIVIATQSGLLWSISPELFGFVLLYCFVMNVLTFGIFGSRLTSANRMSLAQEASLRFGLVRVREHAEAVAFYQGYDFEQGRCAQFFSALMHTLYYKLGLTVCFESLQSTLNLLLAVLPYAVVAGKYLAGDLDFGALSQAGVVLGALERSFNTMVAQLENITAMGAQAMRIRQVWHVLEEMQTANDEEGKPSKKHHHHHGHHHPAARGVCISDLPPESEYDSIDTPSKALVLKVTDVTLQPLVGEVPLVHDLNFDLFTGESLLVKGPSGIGKSFLLRAIGGLWTSGHGSIVRSNAANSFFLPQEPYLCLGSLRDNATYPGRKPEPTTLSDNSGSSSESEGDGIGPFKRTINKVTQKQGALMDSQQPSDEEVKAALAAVGLGYLAERFDLNEIVNLDSVLSGGERQRLGIVRMLLRPKPLALVVLDEATSNLDQANELLVYNLVKSKVKSYISVAHRQSLQFFHTHQLHLERTSVGGCAWSFGRCESP
mmetsp:Transcript_28618/g.62261  ORF Transcript_28618/g.62261 Transcript_28618/m.62261 type:complete len:744 (+) Transcript_28618:305-2536(+)